MPISRAPFGAVIKMAKKAIVITSFEYDSKWGAVSFAVSRAKGPNTACKWGKMGHKGKCESVSNVIKIKVL
jgi:hypothetical protein